MYALIIKIYIGNCVINKQFIRIDVLYENTLLEPFEYSASVLETLQNSFQKSSGQSHLFIRYRYL